MLRSDRNGLSRHRQLLPGSLKAAASRRSNELQANARLSYEPEVERGSEGVDEIHRSLDCNIGRAGGAAWDTAHHFKRWNDIDSDGVDRGPVHLSFPSEMVSTFLPRRYDRLLSRGSGCRGHPVDFLFLVCIDPSWCAAKAVRQRLVNAQERTASGDVLESDQIKRRL